MKAKRKVSVARLTSLAGLAAVIIVLSVSLFKARSGDVAVTVQMIEPMRLEQTVQMVGRLRLREQVDLSARVASEIETIFVDVAQKVKAGDLLVQLKKENQLAELHRAEYSAKEAHVAHELAEVKLERINASAQRLRDLNTKHLISREDAENAERDLRSATLECDRAKLVVEQANALLERAKEDLRSTEIRAPFSGTVLAIWGKVGQVTLPSSINVPASRILTLGGADGMELMGKVTEYEVTRLRIGQAARARFNALSSQVVPAHIVGLSRIGVSDNDFDSTRYEVAAAVDIPPDLNVRPGMTATVTVTISEREAALAVYRQAVFDDSALPSAAVDKSGSDAVQSVAERPGTVWAVVDSKARRKNIKVSFQNDLLVNAVDGLHPGDRIIVAPNSVLRMLRDGTRVRIERQVDAASQDANGKSLEIAARLH
ncbi:MAG: HlyD family secretion protein [Gammaproteobacteria bacterium]|nr:HlyD family secretion protein [Gammaproteobacteria bacterium]